MVLRSLLALVAGLCGACAPVPDAFVLTSQTRRDAASLYEPELGKGVNAAETQTFARCVVYPAVDVQPTGFKNRLYDEYSVRTRQEMDSKLDISATVSARGLWGNVGVSGSYFKNVEMNEDAFYWLVDARYALQHESIDTSATQFELSHLAKRLLAEHGLAAFQAACGTHFYVGRTLGARYNLLYEFRSKEDKFVDRIKAAANYSGFGIEAEAELDKFVAVARKSAYVRVHSGIDGGGYDIADYATDSNTLKRELTRLREDLMVHRQGEVLVWEMMPYDLFPEVVAARAQGQAPTIGDDFKREALALYYRQFTHNKELALHLEGLLARAGGNEPWYVYAPDDLTRLRQAIETLRARNDEIAVRATSCLQSAAAVCSTSDLQPLTFADPQPLRDLSGLGAWSLYPVLRHGSQAMLEFYGSPGEPYAGHFFDTYETLFSSPAGPFVMQQGRRPLLIGTFDTLQTANGAVQPRLCVDEFAAICKLRVIESADARMEDGYPVTRLQLSVFDGNGIQTDKYIFRVRR